MQNKSWVYEFSHKQKFSGQETSASGKTKGWDLIEKFASELKFIIPISLFLVRQYAYNTV